MPSSCPKSQNLRDTGNGTSNKTLSFFIFVFNYSLLYCGEFFVYKLDKLLNHSRSNVLKKVVALYSPDSHLDHG